MYCDTAYVIYVSNTTSGFTLLVAWHIASRYYTSIVDDMSTKIIILVIIRKAASAIRSTHIREMQSD